MFDLQPRHRHRIPCVALHFASSKCVKLPAGLELVVLTASGRASADQVVARLPRRHENAQSQSESQSFAEPKARAGASIQPLSPLLTLRLPRGGAMPEHCLSMGSARPASFLGIESRRSEIESFIKAASRGPSCLFLSFFPPPACCGLWRLPTFWRVWDKIGTASGIGCQAPVFSAALGPGAPGFADHLQLPQLVPDASTSKSGRRTATWAPGCFCDKSLARRGLGTLPAARSTPPHRRKRARIPRHGRRITSPQAHGLQSVSSSDLKFACPS
jgi:hypothetical protein